MQCDVVGEEVDEGTVDEAESSETVLPSVLRPCVFLCDNIAPGLSQNCARSSLDLDGVLLGISFRLLTACKGVTSSGRGGLEGRGPRGENDGEWTDLWGELRIVCEIHGLVYWKAGLSCATPPNLGIESGPVPSGGPTTMPGGGVGHWCRYITIVVQSETSSCSLIVGWLSSRAGDSQCFDTNA